jgi:alpha-galactosidase
MCPAILLRYDMRRKDVDYDQPRRLVAQWHQVTDYYYGDYYPLSSYSLSDDAWMAWQFDRPDLGEGMLEAFRRPESSVESARFRLKGLDPAARYTVTNLDVPSAGSQMSGRELSEQGLLVSIKDQPGAALIVYQRVRAAR